MRPQTARNVIDAYRADAAERAVAMSELERRNRELLAESVELHIRSRSTTDAEDTGFVCGALVGYALCGFVMALSADSGMALAAYSALGVVGLVFRVMYRRFLRGATRRTQP